MKKPPTKRNTLFQHIQYIFSKESISTEQELYTVVFDKHSLKSRCLFTEQWTFFPHSDAIENSFILFPSDLTDVLCTSTSQLSSPYTLRPRDT